MYWFSTEWCGDNFGRVPNLIIRIYYFWPFTHWKSIFDDKILANAVNINRWIGLTEWYLLVCKLISYVIDVWCHKFSEIHSSAIGFRLLRITNLFEEHSLWKVWPSIANLTMSIDYIDASIFRSNWLYKTLEIADVAISCQNHSSVSNTRTRARMFPASHGGDDAIIWFVKITLQIIWTKKRQSKKYDVHHSHVNWQTKMLCYFSHFFTTIRQRNKLIKCSCEWRIFGATDFFSSLQSSAIFLFQNWI